MITSEQAEMMIAVLTRIASAIEDISFYPAEMKETEKNLRNIAIILEEVVAPKLGCSGYEGDMVAELRNINNSILNINP